MRLVADSGLWSTSVTAQPSLLVAVVEVSGAVLSWTVDEPSAPAQIAFTDLPRADWLWRILGESGHATLAAAVDGRSPDDAQTIEMGDVAVVDGSLDVLRRVALGHWLRRWWPASHRDGIAALDAAILDAEIAVLTAAAQDFFTDDTFDSDLESLIRTHTVALGSLARESDPRVTDLIAQCSELADDVGVALDTEVSAVARRDDYALAAGPRAGRNQSGVIASGAESINWGGVPPGIFDAAEGTAEWTVEAAGETVNCLVRVELSGGGTPNGIAVQLQSGQLGGDGKMAADGLATVPVVDAQKGPITESAAWDHDWRATTLSVGADVDESPRMRDRIRRFARSRLAEPADDAFLAEVLAAEADY